MNSSPLSDAKKSIKDEQLPNEIVQTLEKFKSFLADQKKLREEIELINQQSVANILDNLQNLNKNLSFTSSELFKFSCQSNQLKQDVIKEESNLNLSIKNVDASFAPRANKKTIE
ncbi:Nucleoporin p58/p45 [Cichlidogyrus casuarinus]|uniref:Nucleoporin p58/p45 n=1 Tax=Cichlidogyrus casuarinus TaxID=1844966 RepID=A0ABD2PVZ3_9PLAT